jgi:hypothetical protein
LQKDLILKLWNSEGYGRQDFVHDVFCNW